ncbi:hypothetical protein J6590_074034 [Homalodisca vitripennis]|nr:hypothetical protein J6590_074034 [Homalodisca vitripennis]
MIVISCKQNEESVHLERNHESVACKRKQSPELVLLVTLTLPRDCYTSYLYRTHEAQTVQLCFFCSR